MSLLVETVSWSSRPGNASWGEKRYRRKKAGSLAPPIGENYPVGQRLTSRRALKPDWGLSARLESPPE